jgi:hypothetical protein
MLVALFCPEWNYTSLQPVPAKGTTPLKAAEEQERDRTALLIHAFIFKRLHLQEEFYKDEIYYYLLTSLLQQLTIEL